MTIDLNEENKIIPISFEDLLKEDLAPKNTESTSVNIKIGPKEDLVTKKDQVIDQSFDIKSTSQKITSTKIKERKLGYIKTKKTSVILERDTAQELYLTIKECESLSGISSISIRKSIKTKEIDYLLENGKYKISLKSLIVWCYSSARRKNVFDEQGLGKYVDKWNFIL